MLYEFVACLCLLGQVCTQSGPGDVQQALHAGKSIEEILSSADAFYHIDNAQNAEWNYDKCSDIGPQRWGENFPYCNPQFRPPGKPNRQSPINIETTALNFAKFSVGWNYPTESRFLKGKISISSKAPSFAVDCDDLSGRVGDGVDTCRKYELKMSGVGRLINRSDETFVFEKFHFHFTKRDKAGSEHQVNGRKADSVMHVVHFNKKYGSYANAVDKPDGLAVVAFFLMKGDSNRRESKIMNQILEKFNRLIEEKEYRAVLRADLLKGGEKFYTYEGSTTTPSCIETVLWFIRRKPVFIKRKHLKTLRKIRFHDDNRGERIIKHGNVRPIQRNFVPDVFRN